MKILQITAGPISTNAYLVIGNDEKEAILIDTPPESSEEFMRLVEENNLEIRAITLTHSHWDHAADCGVLHDLLKAPVYIHKDDEYRLIDPMKHTIFPLPFEILPHKAEKYLEENKKINFGGSSLNIIHTPGHTEGSVCLIDNESKIIFGGDLIFAGSVGRTDLPGGDSIKMKKSLKEIVNKFPDDFIIYSGHGPETTLGIEKQSNPFLRGLN